MNIWKVTTLSTKKEAYSRKLSTVSKELGIAEQTLRNHINRLKNAKQYTGKFVYQNTYYFEYVELL